MLNYYYQKRTWMRKMELYKCQSSEFLIKLISHKKFPVAIGLGLTLTITFCLIVYNYRNVEDKCYECNTPEDYDEFLGYADNKNQTSQSELKYTLESWITIKNKNYYSLYYFISI